MFFSQTLKFKNSYSVSSIKIWIIFVSHLIFNNVLGKMVSALLPVFLNETGYIRND